jgi:hypothetical protein
MTFVRVFVPAAIAVLVAAFIPLHIVAVLLCWAILVASGWLYAVASARGGALPDLIGYGAGTGALVGAPVSLSATVLTMLVHHSRMDGWTFASLCSSGLWGAILGALGGEIGALRVPRTKSSATQVRTARFVWIGLAIVALLLGGVVAFTIALANAMSDIH